MINKLVTRQALLQLAEIMMLSKAGMKRVLFLLQPILNAAFRYHSVPAIVVRSIIVNDPARARTVLKVVWIRYAKLKIPSWRIGVLKAIHAIPVAQICDALLLAFILIWLIALLIAPIWFSLLMPTGS